MPDTAKPTPGHLKQACGCSLNLHGQSWEQVAESRGPKVTFIYCPTHAAAPRMKEALEAVLPLAEKLLSGLPHGATLAARALLRELDGGQG